MQEISASVDVAVPAERLWSVVTDWPRQGQWIPATRVWVTRGTGNSVGDRVTARTGVGPLAFVDPMEITVWEPPRRCVVHHLGTVIRGEGEFSVVALSADRSRFMWTEWLEAPFGRYGARLLQLTRPVSEATLGAALRRLARQVTA